MLVAKTCNNCQTNFSDIRISGDDSKLNIQSLNEATGAMSNKQYLSLQLEKKKFRLLKNLFEKLQENTCQANVKC